MGVFENKKLDGELPNCERQTVVIYTHNNYRESRKADKAQTLAMMMMIMMVKIMTMMVLFLSTIIGDVVGSITVREGEAFGRRAIEAMSETLSKGSMKDMSDELFADEIEWRWAGDQNGKGPRTVLVDEFANTYVVRSISVSLDALAKNACLSLHSSSSKCPFN